MSSAIVFASVSESDGAPTSNSSWSVMAMESEAVVVVESSLDVEVIVTSQLWTVS